MVLQVGRGCLGGDGRTLDSVSWSSTFPFPLSVVGRWMGGARAGTDHAGVMDLVPNQKPPGSSGVMSRGERSPSWGRWVSEGQGQGVGLEVQGLVMEGVLCTLSLELL